jgi:peptidoglycan/LPS O-acetylase OafA/YrhL
MIKPLTSFRFFFALVVFLSHLSLTNSHNPLFEHLYKAVFQEGYLGVSFFFILSGFVLALNYKNKFLEHEISSRDFWIARIARIYPLHAVTLLVSIPVCLWGITTVPFLWFGKLFLNTFLLQSFVPLPDVYFSFNGASWSISDEFFFYLMFPFIISFFFKYQKTIVSFGFPFLLVLIPLGISLSSQTIIHRFFYINPFLRIVDFMIGIMLYDLYEKDGLRKFMTNKTLATMFEVFVIGMFAFFFACHHLVPQGYRFSCYYWLPMSCIILVFSYQAGYVSGLLSNKRFVLLGEISFGFYMIHQLVILYVTAINTKFALISNDWLLIAVIFIITLAGSYISYYAIEQPCSRLVRQKFKKPLYAAVP